LVQFFSGRLFMGPLYKCGRVDTDLYQTTTSAMSQVLEMFAPMPR
jgi:hypothetical protein